MSAKVYVREAREADAPGIARVHVDSWRTAYAGILPAGYLEGLSVRDREMRWRRILGGGPGDYESRDCVADSAEGGIVGFSSVGPARTSGGTGWELYAIYLLRSWQGAGLGRRLFARALELAVAEDSEGSAGAPVSTWCISANPSRRFYEALGGEPAETQTIEIGGVRLEETRYVWANACELRDRLNAET